MLILPPTSFSTLVGHCPRSSKINVIIQSTRGRVLAWCTAVLRCVQTIICENEVLADDSNDLTVIPNDSWTVLYRVGPLGGSLRPAQPALSAGPQDSSQCAVSFMTRMTGAGATYCSYCSLPAVDSARPQSQTNRDLLPLLTLLLI